MAGAQHTTAYSDFNEKGFQIPDNVMLVFKKQIDETKLDAIGGCILLKDLLSQVAEFVESKE